MTNSQTSQLQTKTHKIIFFSVTGESSVEDRRQSFFPIDADWQETAAKIFGKSKPETCLYGRVEEPVLMPHRRPSRTKNAVGDGACLPRTISLAIYGHQRQHEVIRSKLVDFILKGPLPGETLVRDDAFFQEMETMRKNDEYMTSFEIEALAYMLQTPIYSCVQQKKTNGSTGRFYWQRSPHESATAVTHSRGIYIQNSSDHFKLVTEF